jgi:hypothetical protein
VSGRKPQKKRYVRSTTRTSLFFSFLSPYIFLIALLGVSQFLSKGQGEFKNTKKQKPIWKKVKAESPLPLQKGLGF